MAFGTNSKIFTSYITDIINNTTAMDGNSDTWNIMLYNNTGTPDQTVTSANDCRYPRDGREWVGNSRSERLVAANVRLSGDPMGSPVKQ